MAGFLYFKPHEKKSTVTPQDIEAWGLSYALAGAAGTQCQGNTPTRSMGLVFADPKQMGDFGIKMDMPNQTWRRIPKSELWVGYWNQAKPTPNELARSPQMPGYTARLADGMEWTIPLVRRFDADRIETVSNLPCYMECDEEGNWKRSQVLGIHAHLWDLTTPIADALLAEYKDSESPDVDDAAIFSAVTALLQANYRVGPGELSVLRALSTEASTHAACMVACDWPSFIAWAEEKKSANQLAPDGLITSAGEAA